MLVQTELKQLQTKLRELKTREEQIAQVENWLTNNNISEREYEMLKSYVTPQV